MTWLGVVKEGCRDAPITHEMPVISPIRSFRYDPSERERETDRLNREANMSNGTAEKLHPLQNKWCLWEHKVRHGSLPNSGSSPFVALRLLCSLSLMMRAMTPARREQTLARRDLSPCLCWTQSASTPVPSLLRPRHSKHTELCCLVFNCWKFKVRDSRGTARRGSGRAIVPYAHVHVTTGAIVISSTLL